MNKYHKRESKQFLFAVDIDNDIFANNTPISTYDPKPVKNKYYQYKVNTRILDDNIQKFIIVCDPQHNSKTGTLKILNIIKDRRLNKTKILFYDFKQEKNIKSNFYLTIHTSCSLCYKIQIMLKNLCLEKSYVFNKTLIKKSNCHQKILELLKSLNVRI